MRSLSLPPLSSHQELFWLRRRTRALIRFTFKVQWACPGCHGSVHLCACCERGPHYLISCSYCTREALKSHVKFTAFVTLNHGPMEPENVSEKSISSSRLKWVWDGELLHRREQLRQKICISIIIYYRSTNFLTKSLSVFPIRFPRKPKLSNWRNKKSLYIIEILFFIFFIILITLHYI